MTALSNDAIRKSRGDETLERYTITSASQLYIGSLVSISTSAGTVAAAADAASTRVVGVAVEFQADGEEATGLGNADGTQYVVVSYGAEYEFAVSAAQQAASSIGINLCVADDNTVGAIGTNTVVVGECVAFKDSSMDTAWIAVRRFSDTTIAV